MKITLGQPLSFIQPGRRANQEDARWPDSDAPAASGHVFAVCDGVGGCDKGEVASTTVAQAIGRATSNFDFSRPFTAADFAQVLSEAYAALDEASTAGTEDMGTTLVFICFHSGGVFIAHIGDSRAYHVRPGVGILHQTDDHSLVHALVHSGNLSPDEVRDHPQGNIITRCMSPSGGRKNDKATTFSVTDIEPGDYFLLCTDGVLHELDDLGIYELLSADISDEEKIARMAEICSGSSDNNTAILIPVAEVAGVPAVPSSYEEEASDEDDTTPLVARAETVAEVAPAQSSRATRFINFLKNLLNS